MAHANAATCAVLAGEPPSLAVDRLRTALGWLPAPEGVFAAVETLVRLSVRRIRGRRPAWVSTALRLAQIHEVNVITTQQVVISWFLLGLPEELGPSAYDDAVRDWQHLDCDQAAFRAIEVVRQSTTAVVRQSSLGRS